jgi:hypothetical protein
MLRQGEYELEARLGAAPLPLSPARLLLRVEGPPAFLPPLPPAQLEGACGQRLELECRAEGRPAPEVVWAEPAEGKEGLRPVLLGAGRALGGAGGRLTLQGAGVPGGGLQLVCLARSRVGEVHRRLLVTWPQGCNSTGGEETDGPLEEEVVQLEAGERDAVTLPCPSPGPGPALVQWTRGADLVASWYTGYGLEMPRGCGPHYGLFTGAFGIVASRPSCKVKQVPAARTLPGAAGGQVGAASVSLNWLGRRDGGRYRCAVWSLQGPVGRLAASAAVQLSVRGKPHIEGHSALETHAVVGEPFALHCRATGRPEPTVAWYREGSPLRSPHSLFTVRAAPEGSYLEATRATEKVFGAYSCRATNGEGVAVLHFKVVREAVILLARRPLPRWAAGRAPVHLGGQAASGDGRRGAAGV